MTNPIRLASEHDAAALAEIYAPIVRDTTISFESVPPAASEMAARICKTLEQGYPWLVYDPGRVLGYAYAGRLRERPAYRWSVEVSVYVHTEARGTGAGRALYTSLFEVLRLQGFQNAYAGATLPNPASVGLHESLGFAPIGTYESIGHKFGRWHDVFWWVLRLGNHPARPSDPIPLEQAIELPGWESAIRAGIPLLRG